MGEIRKAREHLYMLCKDPSRFIMSIPVQRDDTDSIFVEAFDYAENLEEKIKLLGSELAKERECVNYYATIENWGFYGKKSIGKSWKDIKPQDQERIKDTWIGGKRARQRIKERHDNN